MGLLLQLLWLVRRAGRGLLEGLLVLLVLQRMRHAQRRLLEGLLGPVAAVAAAAPLRTGK